ncbi:MAG: subtilisin-like proprotein convertase family protein, partial [Rhodothermales bacterium]
RGNGVDVPAATARLDITPQGFHAQILSPGGAVYIDPQVRSRETYVSYYHRNAEQKNHQCLLEDAFATPRPKQDENRAERAIGDTLRTYRLAVTAQGEYTVFHGGAAQAMAAIVTTINRVNGIYETELSVRLELVANNNLLIYTDPATDPYSVNDSSGTTLDENQTNTDAVIGNSDYDVGHIFNTGGGGLASLGVICFNSQKAEGATGRANPVGDAFDVDFVAHELGHQFGADHSFNGVTSSCSNRNSPTAYEPGSGVTIMGYAGICGADDLANNSIPYFNSGSFDQIIAYLDSESCESGTATGNNAPTVSAGSSMTIPALTPFTLTATGSDPDGHAVTYSWEQRDLGPAKLVTNGDDGSGPLFRPWTPTTSPSRTCPRLSDLLANTTVIGESLPATTRTLSFRVTARDNQAGGGGVNTAEVTHNVVATGTAFAVTSPNTAVSWSGAQTVTWDVAGTTANGINAANVDILLSIDGGSSYGMTLASNTPNDGSEAVSIPNLNSTAARIKVQPVGNIFFDISNANFTITPLTDVAFSAGTPTVDDSAGNGNGSVDPGESISLDVLVSNTGTANTGPITATLSSLSGSVTVTAANSAYPGLIGGGPASVNLTPFSIDVGAGHPCGSPVNLRLSLVSAELTETVDLSIDVGVIAGAPDVRPFVVSSNLIDGGTAQVSFDIAGFSGAVADVDFRFDGITCGAAEAATTNGLNHTWISDLTISLISPSGTSVELFRQRTGDFNHMCDLTFDDSATNPISAIPSVSPLTGNFQPEAPLSAFNGENPNGTWRIEISDAFTPDSGTVTGFSLLLTGRECTEADPPALTSFARQTPAIRNTNADTLVFRASFDEDVQGVNAADFAVTGTTATIADVSAVSASVYDITVSGGDLAGLSATVQLDLAGGQNITDLAGNRLPTAEPGTDEDYNVSNSLGPNPRIVRVDPTADMVTLKNFGDASIDLTGYFFCSTFRYPSVSHGILAAGASVTLPFTHGSGMDANADLGLYMNNAGFADPANMVDFVQFGSASHPRETVAVTKGIWSAGDFIASGASYRYIGDGSQYGVAFWATPAISFAQSGGTTDISEDGATDSVDVALTIIPDGTVNLTLSADAQSELSTDGANFSASVSFSLIDTSAQTITVRAINDPTVEGTHTSSITVSVTNNADIDFPASGPSPAFSAAVTDNDAPDFSISESGGNTSVSEAGTTDSFTVVLDARPTSDVVLTVSSSDTGEATVDKANLTFETGNWDTAQTVTVTGVDDPSADGGQTTTITLAVDDANSDDSFDSLADQTVSVTTTDDDVAALILTIAASSISEAAGPAATTATVSRNSDTTNALTVTLSSSDTGEAGVTATVTIPAGQSSSAPFDIDAIDDLLIDGTQTVTITATATAHADG